ncbi:DUF1801 domain-containing protein [Roseibium polysiphoniae]|uniref:DUF1801 domain-containing protein n=1 Tax=Roseibium polysiphoniae TaxID=2571221 RepID=A0ABR9CFG5_9HYPH|nr:DUF1801 domain-containing protein [Roseibium polysiphoniae]MBD8878368.1 DUF1801 domain-containing protein [Roseibium polysiphoniae]
MPETTRACLDALPPQAAGSLERLRQVILQTVEDDPAISQPIETLKWGEIAFVPTAKSGGTTLRIAWKKKKPDFVGLFFHCGTNVSEQIDQFVPKECELDGRRGALFPLAKPLPEAAIKMIAALVLTYRRR